MYLKKLQKQARTNGSVCPRTYKDLYSSSEEPRFPGSERKPGMGSTTKKGRKYPGLLSWNRKYGSELRIFREKNLCQLSLPKVLKRKDPQKPWEGPSGIKIVSRELRNRWRHSRSGKDKVP